MAEREPENRVKPVITVTPTIQSGTVVRWFRSLDAYDNRGATLSASRDGVMIHGDVFLHDLPQEWIDTARVVYAQLTRDRDADVSFLATHRARGFLGPLEPVRSAETPDKR